jgi:hypothetical protein
MKSKQLRPDDKKQSQRFIEKAREIGANEERSASDLLLRQLAKTPPRPHSSHKPAKRG